MSELDPVVREFILESNENLSRMEQDLLALERGETDPELIRRTFRTVHSIKSVCGFLGFANLGNLAHVGENLLAKLRASTLGFTPEIASALFQLIDAIRSMLTEIAANGAESASEHSVLLALLTSLAEGSQVVADSAEAVSRAAQSGRDPIRRKNVSNVPDANLTSATSAANSTHGADKASDSVADTNGESDANANSIFATRVSESSIRVDVDLLDRLMNVAGEIVLARNQLAQYSASAEDPRLTAATQRLSFLTSELQEGITKTRMQPIGTVWQGLARSCRDLALQLGKKVALEVEGSETELDRSIIEAIRDPINHLVRNAIDHGIEAPALRLQRGKPEVGKISLRAYHEGSQVNVQITDDGAGIDVEVIREQGIAKGFFSPEQAKRMSEPDLVNAIFLPGFSTKENASEVSGRGVGMDVVKTQVEKVGGSVELISVKGAYTTLSMKIPLTLAILPAMLVSVASDRYAIPQSCVSETLRVDPGSENPIETLHGHPVFRLRGNLLPLIELSKKLQIQREEAALGQSVINIVVLKGEGKTFGVIVDAVHDTEEVVVKALGRHVKNIPLYAGATILGDGSVALILDVLGLAKQTSVIASTHETLKPDLAEAATAERAASQVIEELLIVRGESEGRIAIPLAWVSRLEEISRQKIERIGDCDAIQYRGDILPLISLEEFLSGARRTSLAPSIADAQGEAGAEEKIAVVVFSFRERQIGLAVREILDIAREEVSIARAATRSGVLKTLVVQERITELLDIESLAGRLNPAFFEARRSNAEAAADVDSAEERA